ncbi:HD domain-containing protein [Stutzerimonas stutzeri]|uniref:Bifunctional (P)ppGpp synthetase/guanosine-3',5'-bis(Diphosphate) 3'-pyrophosphohydrolase n=1 Tax=Stutzerimonas stutzeri TaxID=316 RepID=A0AA40RTX8_STUST|nr:HD domain-containing protein [Stutzerimonas stutzeri]MBA1305961.1 bifunctional (p)ppGpp synthetase/guanosine-3',5'-bis(diphosphate) 3'-pyrophosphohydrolase [Stutzerimonas stutzeri]
MSTDSTLILRARSFCIAAHSAVKQTRKYTGEPYWHHPLEVAALVREHAPEAPDEVIAAAMLHDVIDDTGVRLELIRIEFGAFVAELVDALSDDSTAADGNRRTRKAMEREKIAKAPAWAKTIRLADLYSNVPTIAEYDPKFAKTYLPEKRLLLPHLAAGNPTLYGMVNDAIERYFALHPRT